MLVELIKISVYLDEYIAVSVCVSYVVPNVEHYLFLTVKKKLKFDGVSDILTFRFIVGNELYHIM